MVINTGKTVEPMRSMRSMSIAQLPLDFCFGLAPRVSILHEPVPLVHMDPMLRPTSKAFCIDVIALLL